MKQKVVCLVVAVLLGMTGLVWGAENSSGQAIDLSTAVRMAMEQNLDLKLAQIILDNSRLDYQKTKAQNLVSKSKYTEMQAEYNLASAENTYRNTANNVVINTVKKYSNLLLSQLNVTLQEKKVALEERLLNETKKQVELGDKGALDLMQQENSYRNALYDLEEARNTVSNNLREFKNTLGLVESPVEFQPIEPPVRWEATEETALSVALENSMDLKLKEKKLELATVDLERVQVSSTSELDKKVARNNVEMARLEVDQTRSDITTSIQKQYYEFVQAFAKLELQKQNLSTAKEEYRIVKEQRSAGLKTENDVLEAEISLLQAQYQYESAIAACYEKQLSLKQSLYLETGVLINDLTQQK